MTIFNLHHTVLDDYSAFVRSFIHIADDRIRDFVHGQLDDGHLWPDFLLQVSPTYARTASVDELTQRGLLHEETARIFRTGEGTSYRLYQHQVEALEKAAQGRSYVVTSGTGSGKSLTYFIPIVDSILKHPVRSQVIALIIYPMNALVNSQLQALETLRQNYEARFSKPFPLRFARYTGETRNEERQAIRRDPPHIILTNYVMAELMLVRPEDHRLLDKKRGGLRFLVFDELEKQDERYRRRRPQTIPAAAERLAEETGLDAETCYRALVNWLTLGSQIKSTEQGRAFAFNLHFAL